MKKNLGAILLVLGLFLIIVALNLVFIPDNASQEDETNGDRSSYRTTPYGTRAFYSLLDESGYPVERLNEPYDELKDRQDIGTLVIIAPPQRNNPTEEEFKALVKWIEDGGCVIVIDHDIDVEFGEAKANTQFSFLQNKVRVMQPTAYTRGVNTVAVSAFAKRVKLDSPSTVYHIGDDYGGVLADAQVGEGHIVLLTDPFMVANNGIAQADNVVLALNLFNGRPPGKIAFDEYHHGYRSGDSVGVVSYFRGTPIPWMLAQLGLIALLVVYTYGRRFARPLPLKRESRTTNLEFVSSMANITRLARATDLAMQNVYHQFHNQLCRYVGLPPGAETSKLAAAVARRSRFSEDELRGLLSRCEAVASGAKVSDTELLTLVTRLRDIGARLKL